MKYLCITRRELAYTAVMAGLKQLVNVVYDFPADGVRFNSELDDARRSLRQKKLLEESAKNGISLNFSLRLCALFCSDPESCEVVEFRDYYATIYYAGGVWMLLEKRPCDSFAAVWFLDKRNLDKYLDDIEEAAKEEEAADGSV